MMTNHAGAPVEDVLFYPWGQAWNTWGSGGYNFAELPYDDPTTNTNLATFRLQSPSLGRWLSPDPLGGDITNPQSLNLYPYVMNNPTSLVDPLGLQEECSQSNDPYDCCNDPNYIGAECGGPGWPPGFWPPINWGGFGGGGPTVSLPGGAGPSDAALGNEWVNTLPCLGPQATIDLAAALIGIVNGRFGTNIQNNSSQVYYANPTEGLTVVAMVQPGGIVPTNGIGDFGNTS